MSVSKLVSHIQTLSELLENASGCSNELLHFCHVTDDDLSIEDIGEMFGHGKGLHIDGTITIKDYLRLAAVEVDSIEDMLE
jgi:hypothetical protein